ncbi:DUF1178 family protein [Croceicoccus sp. YJ47]|uniref:DUF1178 family protein n=1 Tax=Croceicoccus sp. YJ47 TaxID=2798724 RepID=UPI001921FD8B|nr:DUF1178 family protein [Croceicoccus sp. YJ47]QQN73617.1 DUF1178 family protein [Croceicoccus sp. YJ47]
MIVFDLCCQSADHRFEAWFRSSADFERQKRDGLLMCPQCGSADVEKAVMAPAVGRKGNRDSGAPSVHTPQGEGAAPVPSTASAAGAERGAAAGLPEAVKTALVQLADLQKRVIEKSRWVGRSFAEEARAIHYGEKDAEPIYGEASPEESRALADEGVEVAPLLFPVAPPDKLN